MARLFVTKQVARAANVEVVTGELEPGAEAVEIAQDLQPLFSNFGQLHVSRRGQVGIGAQF